MRKFGITLFASIITLLAISQNVIDTAERNYTSGTQALRLGNYKKAEALYTLAIDSMPYIYSNAHYNRAIARMKMENTKGFCEDIKMAISKYDSLPAKLFLQYCLQIDTIFYSDNYDTVSNNPSRTEFIFKEKYSDKLEGIVKDSDGNAIVHYFSSEGKKWYTLVPNMPMYLGKYNNMHKFIKKNIVFPESELDAFNKYPGTFVDVFIQFDVSKSGKVKNVKLTESTDFIKNDFKSENFLNEAIRVIHLLPDFFPGVFNGEYIDVRYEIPIRFKYPKIREQ